MLELGDGGAAAIADARGAAARADRRVMSDERDSRPQDPPGSPGGGDQFEAISRLVRLARDGDADAADELMRLLQATLREIAHRQRRRGMAGETLRTTALINEAFLKLLRSSRRNWRDREHFVALLARAMRQVLVDNARRRGRQQGQTIEGTSEFDHLVDRFQDRAHDLLQLDEALTELARVDPDLERLVELRFFGGLPMDEIAQVLQKPLRSLERDWQTVRAWLLRRLS